MKNITTSYLICLGIFFFHLSCESFSSSGLPGQEAESEDHADVTGSSMQPVFLSDYKFQNVDIRVDTMPLRHLDGIIHVNGELAISPHNKAAITPVKGGNLESIEVIEGDRVRKGQPVAYITHPDFTKLQSDYLHTFSKLEFFSQEYDRQKRLYEEEVGAGRSFQKTKSELNLLNVELRGYEAQLRQLNLDPEKIQNEKIYERIPVLSPITGFVEKITIQLGQYVQPETSMMSIVNVDQVYADLMVFEKDISKVKVGQNVSITLESQPGKEISGKIYSIGKSFEKNTKSVHVHARITGKGVSLLPGMYLHGRIQATTGERVMALPESGVIDEEGRSYIFIVQNSSAQDPDGWTFAPIEIRKGTAQDDWIEVRPLTPLPQEAQVVWDGAYYLISEMKKGEFEDD